MILISGSSGFIGKNILEALPNSKGISLRKSGWCNEFNHTSTIVNLVGKAHNHFGTATEKDYKFANVELTQLVYQEFLKSPATLLIHLSSIAAIEEFQSLTPLKETDICNPSSWYGQTKREAEEWLLSQQLPGHKKLIILRPPMVHGPGDKGNLALLFKLISNRIPYPLVAFDNNRSFISIDNFCFYLQQIIGNQEKIQSGIYHVADDEGISTKQIIEVIENVTGNRVLNLALPKSLIKGIAKVGDILPLPLNSYRLKKMTSNLLVSNRKINSVLGISKLPFTAIEGLIKTIESFNQ